MRSATAVRMAPLLTPFHLDRACRDQVEEFTALQRGLGLRVELLMPGPAGPATTPWPATEAAPVQAPAVVPGPGAEWFYLDTRPLPDDYAGHPPLVG